jgi:hypothetical protein
MKEINNKKRCKDTDFSLGLQDNKSVISDLDILRKAYELILDNSDLFFKELGKAFTDNDAKSEFRPLI